MCALGTRYQAFALSQLRLWRRLLPTSDPVLVVAADEMLPILPAAAAAGVRVVTFPREQLPHLPVADVWSEVSWWRLFLPDLAHFDSSHMLLYVDIDTCVDSGVARVPFHLLQGHIVCAYKAQELPEWLKGLPSGRCSGYAHSAVLLINVALWRANGLAHHRDAWLAEQASLIPSLPRLDQDVLNLALGAHITDLGVAWCWAPGERTVVDKGGPVLITHWAGTGKPWVSPWFPPLLSTWRWRRLYLAFARQHHVPGALLSLPRSFSLDDAYNLVRYYLPPLYRLLNNIGRRRRRIRRWGDQEQPEVPPHPSQA